MSATLLPGFADPVRDSQATFRAVLDAMARPGQIHVVAPGVTAPPPLAAATAAAILTLIDADTPVFLDRAAAAAADWVAFHCGAPSVDPGAAQFAVLLHQRALTEFSAGSDEEPERGATLILQLAALGEGERFRLDGPGLNASAAFACAGLPADFAAAWEANRRRFPRGVDLILTAGDRLAALPRTVRVVPL